MTNHTPDFVSVTRSVVGKLVDDADVAGRLSSNILAKYTPRYFWDHNFTTAVLVENVAQGTVPDMLVGTSKRNKTDEPNPLRGKCLALSRAIKAYVRLHNED